MGGSFDNESYLQPNIDAMIELKAQCKDCKVPGNTIRWMVQSCRMDFPTGWKFYAQCGAKQHIEEAKRMKMIKIGKEVVYSK